MCCLKIQGSSKRFRTSAESQSPSYGTVEFQNGRFRRYRASKGGPPRALGQKQKLKALSLKKVVPTFVPEADETRHGVTWRHSARDGAENWVQLE